MVGSESATRVQDGNNAVRTIFGNINKINMATLDLHDDIRSTAGSLWLADNDGLMVLIVLSEELEGKMKLKINNGG